jgi:flagellin
MSLYIQGGIIMVLQHNMQAANTNRYLNVSVKAQAGVTEKLSSGYRVNRAADDAAGLNISEKMRAQIRGLNQANRNSEDGISLIQTAEGALQEIHTILQRMSELATQGANDTNVTADRHALKLELTALSSEITRIANTTEFNTMKLLSGNFKSKNLQVGANYMQHISISISGMTASKLHVQNSKLQISNYKVATATISVIHAAINKVSDQRSQLGALQNRLEHTINNLSNVAENLQAAESQIRDTDMATTMVEYSKNNIIQQAAQSMLSQANQSTQGVLSLLQ